MGWFLVFVCMAGILGLVLRGLYPDGGLLAHWSWWGQLVVGIAIVFGGFYCIYVFLKKADFRKNWWEGY